jgi:hypothetical protein
VAADGLESVFFRLFGMTTRTIIVDRRLAHAMAGPVAVCARRALALHGFDFSLMMTARITTGLPPQCATIFDAAAPRVAALMQTKPPLPALRRQPPRQDRR